MSKRKSDPAPLPSFLQPVTPWQDPVDGASVLNAIRDAVRRFMVLPNYAGETVALWVMFAHAHEAAEHSPILAIESPEKRCGKTTLLNIIAKLVPVPLPAANISTASIFRSIEKYGPTLLLDEVETFIRDNEEMRGVLNSGFTRDSALVIRTVGDAHDPQPFKTWCPKVGALIGKLPDTLQDRAIVLVMRRRLESERTERFMRRHHSVLFELRAMAARWALDSMAALRDADPEMPRGLGDRAEDAWRPLLAIADLTGDDWPELARKAALDLSGVLGDEAESASKGVLLLTHIRDVFNEKGSASLPSTQLLDALNENEEWPWGEWRQGKAITTRGVANILKPYGIRPARGRAGSSYTAKDFKDAWQRYLTPHSSADSVPSATPATASENPRSYKAVCSHRSNPKSATSQPRLQIANPHKAPGNKGVLADVALEAGEPSKTNGSGLQLHSDDAELF